MKKKIICYVAGRSGGHLIPMLTMAQEYKKKHPDGMIIFFSTNTPLEISIVKASGLVDVHYPFAIGPTPWSFFKFFPFLARIIGAWLRTMWIFLWTRPSEVRTSGGYIAIPVCFAARLLWIHSGLWELNAVPGRATRVLGLIVNKINLCFMQCGKYLTHESKMEMAPYPVRFTDPAQSREVACTHLKLDPQKKIVVVLGGSQGSVYINNLVRQWVNTDRKNTLNLQVAHQTGSPDISAWTTFYTSYGMPSYVCAYTHKEIESLYAAADLIICRAGAGTLFEVAFFNKRAIVIPHETDITAHQIDNAQAISYRYPYLFTTLRQKDIQNDPTLFYKQMDRLLSVIKS